MSTSSLDDRTRTAIEGAREAYARDGVCCLRGVVSPKWIEVMRAALDEISRSPSVLSKTWLANNGDGRFFQDVFVWRQIHALKAFALESEIAEHIASIINTDELRLYSDHVFIREGSATKETPWHQDESYCFVAGEQFCSVWMPLDPVARSECLQLVKGSHKDDLLYSPVEFASGTKYGSIGGESCATSPAEIGRAHRIAAWDLEPGDCIVFSARTLHGSKACPPLEGRRRIYVTRWIGDDARYKDPAWKVPPMPFAPGLQNGARFSGEFFPLARSSRYAAQLA